MKVNRVHVERLGTGSDLVLIHGWAASNGVWRAWVAEHLAPHYRCHLIELPGHGDSPVVACDEKHPALLSCWLQDIVPALPEGRFALLGWSLGGLLAQCLAERYPQRISHLILLATTPRFVQTEDWTWGIPPVLIRDFMQALVRDVAQLLRRFWTLQWQGDERSRLLMRQFVQEMRQRRWPHVKALRQGLLLLQSLDCRPLLPLLHMPTLWLLGERDPLIRADMVESLAASQPHAQIHVMPKAAHLPFRAWPEETAQAILTFLKESRREEVFRPE